MERDNDRWVAELRARQEPALSALRNSLLRNLRRSLAHQTRADESFLEDIVQESLLRVLDKLDLFEGRSRFVTWATSISIRVCLGELRRSRWKDVSLDDVTSGAEFFPQLAIDADLTPDAQAQRQALLAALRDAIECELTARQRTALLAELKGMPQDEIARNLGSNRNALYKLTHDARTKLKKRLEAVGYTAEDVVATCAH